MSTHNTSKVRFTIANGATDSEWASELLSAGQLKTVLGALERMTVFGPAALTGTVSVEVVSTEGDTTGETLQDEIGVDISIGADKAVQITTGGFRDFRFHSSAAEGAERTIDVVFNVRV